jgi:hypothetical protein
MTNAAYLAVPIRRSRNRNCNPTVCVWVQVPARAREQGSGARVYLVDEQQPKEDLRGLHHDEVAREEAPRERRPPIAAQRGSARVSQASQRHRAAERRRWAARVVGHGSRRPGVAPEGVRDEHRNVEGFGQRSVREVGHGLAASESSVHATDTWEARRTHPEQAPRGCPASK